MVCFYGDVCHPLSPALIDVRKHMLMHTFIRSLASRSRIKERLFGANLKNMAGKQPSLPSGSSVDLRGKYKDVEGYIHKKVLR